MVSAVMRPRQGAAVRSMSCFRSAGSIRTSHGLSMPDRGPKTRPDPLTAIVTHCASWNKCWLRLSILEGKKKSGPVSGEHLGAGGLARYCALANEREVVVAAGGVRDGRPTTGGEPQVRGVRHAA